jgi:chromosome segregation ATPase
MDAIVALCPISMSLKVQHNHRESGPYSVEELRQATDSGRICMMDWCWDHKNYDGIMTVYQVLCEGRLGGIQGEQITQENPNKPAVKQGTEPAKPRAAGDAVSEAAHAAMEDYKRRLEYDMLNTRMKLAEDRKRFEKEIEYFYHDRSKLEADLAHAREDIARVRESIAEDRKRLTEHYKRHSQHVEAFNAMRRQTLSDLAGERRRLTEELSRVTDSEHRLNREREDWEKARQHANAEAEDQRRRTVEDQRRLQETMQRMNEEKAGFEQRWQSAYEKLDQERKRITEESRQLLELERRTRAEKQELEEQRRRFVEEVKTLKEGTQLLEQERKTLEQEKKRLEQERKEVEDDRRSFERRQAANNRHERSKPQPAVAVVKDEKYYGRVLGLRGKVTMESIRRAYRSAAQRCHPDKVQDMHPDFEALATEMIREVNEAFDFFKERYNKSGD